MKYIMSHIRLIYLLTLAILVNSCFSSCVNEDGVCTPDTHDKDAFQLRFQIVTKSGTATRAADIEGQQVGAGAENFLNVDDIRYLIFDKDRKFLADISANATTVATNDLFTLYDVVAEVDDPYFLENIEGTIDFYLMVLANHTGWGIMVPELTAGDDISAIFNNGLTMTVLPETDKLQKAVVGSDEERQYMPMSGLQRFTFPGNMLLATWESLPYDISLATGKNVNLLRSLAKIEIIDKINIDENSVFDPEIDDNGFRLTKVEIDGYMSQGSLIPTMDQWSRNMTFETQQVVSTTIPMTAQYHLPPVLNDNNTFGNSAGFADYSLSFEKDDYATNQREDKCPVFSCYVYEYLKAPTAEVPMVQQPYFRVTTKGDATLNVESMVLPVRMANYTDGYASSQNNFDQLLRNHIYRFEITAIHQDIIVNWTVCPMDQATSEIEFN